MREKNQKDSRKRLNALILLVAFTAVLLIVSTYAWFSTQRNVVLNGLSGQVNVAEGLQVSLDAKHWVNSINFNDFTQTSATSWTVKDSATTTYLDAGKTFQAPADGITNVVPTEYLPVSTTAQQGEGIEKTGLIMYNGTYTDSEGLKDIGIATEASDSGFFAFDLYLMNTTSGDSTTDKLQLDSVSDVIGTNEATGIQNTVRVGLALYGNSGAAMKIGQTTEPDQTAIIAGTSTDKNITDVAIWEPNADAHADTIVNSKSNSLKLLDNDNTTYQLTANAAGISTFTNGKKLPTYALTATSKTTGTIKDVYDWKNNPTTTGLTKQNTTQTVAQTGTDDARPAPIDLMSAANGTTPVTIIANQYQKMRVYVWIEGQDPDCINYASLGQGLTLNLGLSKPETTTGGD